MKDIELKYFRGALDEDMFSLGLPEIPEVDIEYQDADPNDSCDGGGCAI
jgi:hypothetical protein